MSIFTFLQWLWLILLVAGLPLLVLRPVMLKRGEKKALTDRAKAWLWFLQALGFWAVIIGGWMKLEAVIPTLLEEEEPAEADAEGDDEDDSPRKRRAAEDDEDDDKEEGAKDDSKKDDD